MLRLIGFFLPGGQILSVIGTAFSLVSKFFGWLISDIADAFKEPQRLVVRLVCALLILGLGVHMGMNHKAEELRKWKGAHAQLLKDSEIADGKNKELLASALKAKAAAEARVVADAAKPAAAPRLRVKRPAAGANSPKGQSLSGIFSVQGKAK